jgi:hypothetical protein
MTKPPVPLAMADRLIAVLSALPKTTYVIFGKTDNTAINLSDIASGTVGFTINGDIRPTCIFFTI